MLSLVLPILESIAKVPFQIPSVFFSFAISSLVTLGFPVLTASILVDSQLPSTYFGIASST